MAPALAPSRVTIRPASFLVSSGPSARTSFSLSMVCISPRPPGLSTEMVPSVPISTLLCGGRVIGPPSPSSGMAVHRQRAVRVHRRSARAGIGFAVAVLHREVALAGDRHVERTAGLAHACRLLGRNRIRPAWSPYGGRRSRSRAVLCRPPVPCWRGSHWCPCSPGCWRGPAGARRRSAPEIAVRSAHPCRVSLTLPASAIASSGSRW
jgi:hypothetical protein